MKPLPCTSSAHLNKNNNKNNKKGGKEEVNSSQKTKTRANIKSKSSKENQKPGRSPGLHSGRSSGHSPLNSHAGHSSEVYSACSFSNLSAGTALNHRGAHSSPRFSRSYNHNTISSVQRRHKTRIENQHNRNAIVESGSRDHRRNNNGSQRTPTRQHTQRYAASNQKNQKKPKNNKNIYITFLSALCISSTLCLATAAGPLSPSSNRALSGRLLESDGSGLTPSQLLSWWANFVKL
jgi:hypothetical protein